QFEKGKTEAAAADVYQACALAPRQKEVLMAAADMALVEGNFAAARIYLDRGLELFPKLEHLYRTLATLEARGHCADEAIVCLQRGLTEVPDSMGLRIHLADLLSDQGPAKDVDALLCWVTDHNPPPGVVPYLE